MCALLLLRFAKRKWHYYKMNTENRMTYEQQRQWQQQIIQCLPIKLLLIIGEQHKSLWNIEANMDEMHVHVCVCEPVDQKYTETDLTEQQQQQKKKK